MTGEVYSSSQIIESWLTCEIGDAEAVDAKLREAEKYNDVKLVALRFLLADHLERSGAATKLLPRDDLHESESVEEPPEEVPPETPQDAMPKTKTAAIEQVMGGDSLRVSEIMVRLRSVGFDPGTEKSVRSLLYQRHDHFSRIRPGVWRAVPEPRPVDRGRTDAAIPSGETVEEPAATKRCLTCSEVKPLEMFGKHVNKKGGLQSSCRDCASRYGRDYRAKAADQRPEPVPGATKTCSSCGEIKLLEMFALDGGRKDGRQYKCRVCDRQYSRDRVKTRQRPEPEPELVPLPTETFSTQPSNCGRCDARMSTHGEYPVCVTCGWEDYGKPEEKLVKEANRRRTYGG